MSTDTFEDTLREMLRESVDAEGGAYLDLDPAVVVVRGRRVVRRRRAVVGASVAAASLVVGLVGFTAIGGGADRATVPAETATTRATGTITAELETSELRSEGDGSLSQAGQKVQVALDRATGVVRYSTLRDDTPRIVEAGRTPSTPGAVTWTSLSTMRLLMGVMPEEAVQFQLVTPAYDEGGHASTFVNEPLAGTGLQAFAVSFAEVGDAGAVSDILWWGKDRAVHDAMGATVPSVALRDPDGTVVYVSRELDRMGTFSDGDGTTMMELDGSRNSSGRPVLSTGRGDGGVVSWLFAAIVPAGAEPGTVTPAQGATVTTRLTKALVPGTNLAILWSRQSSPKAAKGSGYASVTWTENGRTVTQTP